MAAGDPEDASRARVRRDYDRRVEAAAHAMFTRNVISARAEIDGSDFELSELENFIIQIRKESETAQILVFYSYFDDRLQRMLESRFEALDSKNSIERIFGLNGPLSSFHNRTLIAFHLGWLSADTKQKLDAMRKIRNEFAHRAFRVSLLDPELKRLAEAIGYDETLVSMLEAAFEVSDGAPGFPELGKNRTLCKLLLLALRTFEDILVLPVARQYSVPPAAIATPYEEAPALLRRIRTASTRAILLALGEEVEGEVVW